MRATGGAALGHPLSAMLTPISEGGAAFGDGDEAVPVGVKAGERGLCPGLGLGDHDRSTFGPLVGAAESAPVGATRATFHPDISAMLTPGVELRLADHAIVVGVQPIETRVGATRHPGTGRRAHLVAGDGAVVIGVGYREAADPGVDELGSAEALVAISVGAKAAGLGSFRRLLRRCGAAGGEGQGGQSGRHKGGFHLDVSRTARRGLTSLSGE